MATLGEANVVKASLETGVPQLEREEIALLSFLFEARHLGSQTIGHWFLKQSVATQRRKLGRLWEYGLIHRLAVFRSNGTRCPSFIFIREDGVRLVQGWYRTIPQASIPPNVRISGDTDWCLSDDPPDAEERVSWSEPNVADWKVAVHDARCGSWVLECRSVLGDGRVRDYLGAVRGYLRPPRARDRAGGELRPKRLDRYGMEVGCLALTRCRGIRPDMTMQLSERRGLTVDLMVEYESGRRASTERVVRKLQAYDAFLTAWCCDRDRYAEGTITPRVVFVCEDMDVAAAYARQADQSLTGTVAVQGGEVYPGRDSVYFAAERDIYHGSLRAYRVPEQPPRHRSRSQREVPLRAEATCVPV